MSRLKKKSIKQGLASMKIWQLVLGLFLVVGFSVVFVFAVSGIFNGRVAVVDPEYRCTDCDGEYMELSLSGYEDLIKDKKSFVVFVDQGGCTTADRLREYMAEYAKSAGIKVYRMMYEDVKKSSLHDYVKFYPSVAVISRGEVIKWLRADSDEDAPSYNEYEAFKTWMQRYLK